MTDRLQSQKRGYLVPVPACAVVRVDVPVKPKQPMTHNDPFEIDTTIVEANGVVTSSSIMTGDQTQLCLLLLASLLSLGITSVSL
jgi:hypothetical protein